MITKMIKNGKNEKINILTWPSLWLQVFHNFRGIRDALHFSKYCYQSDPTRPEAGKKTEKPIKTECLPFPYHSHRLFWQDMKGIWEN